MTGPGCQRCHVDGEDLRLGAGTLHLRLPQAHALGKFRGWLADAGFAADVRGLAVSVDVASEDATVALLALLDRFGAREAEDVAVLFVAAGASLSIDLLLTTRPLPTFLGHARSHWLRAMLHEERLAIAVQPIVHADGRPFAHECLVRGIEGDTLVPPNRLFDVARGADLLFPLDQAARNAAIRAAHASLPEGLVFINFTPSAIYDPVFCLSSTLRTLDALGLAHDRIVFEVVESDRVDDHTHLRRILDFYRAGGFKVALDDVGAGYSSLNLLHRVRPDFIKLDMELIRGVDADPYKALIAAKLLETASGLGVAAIAEGVETEAEAAWCRQHGATYLQGWLFGKPRVVPQTAGAVALRVAG